MGSTIYSNLATLFFQHQTKTFFPLPNRLFSVFFGITFHFNCILIFLHGFNTINSETLISVHLSQLAEHIFDVLSFNLMILWQENAIYFLFGETKFSLTQFFSRQSDFSGTCDVCTYTYTSFSMKAFRDTVLYI